MWTGMLKMTFSRSAEKTQASQGPSQNGKFPRRTSHELITPPTSLFPDAIMSVASPFRHQSLRLANSWTCSSCSRSLARLPRARNPAFTPARRWLNTTKDVRQSHVPRMDQMHARYKEKNRTVMYALAISWRQVPWLIA